MPWTYPNHYHGSRWFHELAELNTVRNEECAVQGFTIEFEVKERKFSGAAERRVPRGHVEYEKESQYSGHFGRTLSIGGRLSESQSHITMARNGKEKLKRLIYKGGEFTQVHRGLEL